MKIYISHYNYIEHYNHCTRNLKSGCALKGKEQASRIPPCSWRSIAPRSPKLTPQPMYQASPWLAMGHFRHKQEGLRPNTSLSHMNILVGF